MHGAVCVTIGNYFLNVTLFATHTERKFVRRLMERFFSSLDYQLDYQPTQIEVGERKFDIPYICPELDQMPIIIVGDKTGDAELDLLDKCTLDQRIKGERRQKSPQATMLDYLNNTEHVYGIVTNGQVLRLIRNTGQLVKLTYIEFDIRRMVEEDHYAEFCLLFRLMHSSVSPQQRGGPRMCGKRVVPFYKGVTPLLWGGGGVS